MLHTCNIFRAPVPSPTHRVLRGTVLPLVGVFHSHTNTQNKMIHRRPTPAALPPPSMATSAMDPNRGAAAPYESIADAWRSGLCALRLVTLFGAPK